MAARLTDEERLLRAVPEAQVQLTLTDGFTYLGYQWHHETDSRLSPSGMPDLFAIHPVTAWMVICEVKKEKGKLRPQQRVWLQAAGYDPDGEEPFVVHHQLRRVVGIARPSSLDAWLEMLVAGSYRGSPS